MPISRNSAKMPVVKNQNKPSKSGRCAKWPLFLSNFKQGHKHIKVIVDQKINQGCKASDHLQLKVYE